MKRTEQSPLCVSIFKNGERATTQNEFTKAWIELIKLLEKGKQVSRGRRG